MLRRLAIPLLTLLAALSVPTAAGAQTTITLEGVVVNEAGKPIENAQITAVDSARNESRSALTRANGEFRFLGLTSGRYVVSARFIGYRPASEVVQLVLGQRARLSFRLEPGAVELQAVRVEEDRVKSVEVQRLSVSTAVLQEEIKSLPSSTRSVMNLAAVAPGIRSYAPQQGRSIPSAGAVPDLRFINLYLDGVEMKSMFNGNLVGIPQTGSPLPQDALEEFRVFLNPYDAEYSHAGAYVISAVSRRGTNVHEGSAFGFLQNKNLINKTEFQRNLGQKKPDFNRQQLGFNLRGPIVRDKLFYATSYEYSNTANFIEVTTPATSPQFSQYAGSFRAPNQNHTGLARVTYTRDPKNSFDLIWSSRYMTGGSNFGTRTAREGGITQKYFINTALLRHQYLPSSGLMNELSFQLVNWLHDEDQLVHGPQLTYPSVILGTAGFPLKINETHLRLVDRVTKGIDRYGSHLLKAGVELSHVNASQYAPNNRDGNFTYATDASTLPQRASIALGYYNTTGDEDAKSALSGWVTGAYVNDEWRPVPNFTLNLGLRYDAEINTLNNKFTVPWTTDFPELASSTLLQPYLNKGNRKNDLNNISPRISFSWDVNDDGRTFLRGGFGIIYDRVTTFTGFGERRDASWRTYTFNNPGTNDPEVLRQRIRAGGVTATPAFQLLKDKMETPMSRQFSLGLGQQVTPSLGFNLDLIHQRVSNLYVRWNPNYLNLTTNTRPISNRVSDINLWDDFGKARTTALVSTLTYQKRGFRLSGAYTLAWQKADFDAAGLSPIYPFLSSFEMQRVSSDERHRLVVSSIGPLPFGFQVSTIATLASPRPYVATVGNDPNRNNLTADDFIGTERVKDPPHGFNYWYKTVDLRVQKKLSVYGQSQVSLMADFFNLFNWVNYSSIQGVQSNAAGQPLAGFGVANATFAARQAQVGMRWEW
jgi:carboxypeptidase family protein